MLKKTFDFLADVPMMIVGGLFLAASLVLMLTGTEAPLDPAWATALICGAPLLYLAIWRLFNNKGISKISSALLISIAMLAAIAIGDIFAAGEVAFIMAIGGILEDKTAQRAKKGLKKLINLAPQQGRRIRNGKEEMVRAEKISKGDILRILPGETVPLDGEITSGNTSIDQAIITGESLPVDKEAGDDVFCGTLNRFGAIEIRATKVGEDYLKRLSTEAVKTIKFSIGLSLAINFVAIFLSVMGLLTPTTGALVHNAGSILVVLIAALLYDRKFIDTPQQSGPPKQPKIQKAGPQTS